MVPLAFALPAPPPASGSFVLAARATLSGAAGRDPLPAVVRPDCAPWDGSAFHLTIPLPPHRSAGADRVEIGIWRAPTIDKPVLVMFPSAAGRNDGAALLHQRDGQTFLLVGWLRLEPVRTGRPVLGSFALTARNQPKLTGSFRALWQIPVRPTRCG